MLVTYNVIDAVHFSTKKTNGSISPIVKIFIDKTRNYTISSLITVCPTMAPK
jgi:uncharacterized membrane protein (GlpM family)